MNSKSDHGMQLPNGLKAFYEKHDSFFIRQPNMADQLLSQAKDFRTTFKEAQIAHSALTWIPKQLLKSNRPVFYAYILFSRIFSLSNNIKLSLNAKVKPYSWDYTSLCINTRILIEAVEMLFYIYLEDVSEDEREFREIYQKVRISKYNKKFFKQASESEYITQDYKELLNAGIKGIDEIYDILKTEANSNEFYKELLNKNRAPLLEEPDEGNFREGYFHQQRVDIEAKMDILDPIQYIGLYHELSSFVHPYEIYGDPTHTIKPEDIKYFKMCHISAALTASILYLRYATANIIHKLLLNEIHMFSRNWVINKYNESDLKRFQKGLQILQDNPKSIPNAKELKLVNIKRDVADHG